MQSPRITFHPFIYSCFVYFLHRGLQQNILAKLLCVIWAILHCFGPRNLKSGFVVDSLDEKNSQTLPKQKLPTPTRAPCFSKFLGPLSWCGCRGCALLRSHLLVLAWWWFAGWIWVSAAFRLAWRVSSARMVLASCLYFPEHLRLEVEAKAKTVVKPTLDLLGMGRSRSFEFNMCSQERAKFLVKA